MTAPGKVAALSERLERVGLAISLAVVLVLSGLILGQACRIIAQEREMEAQRVRIEECSDLGDLTDEECRD